ncbi:MAG: hypothetical protein IIB00_08700, partial [candidate division Zixibacteria bacterium]|nr:hypothetical protein [candidate division Zixibacteria bacterium]
MKTDTATASPALEATMPEKEMTFNLNLSDRGTIYEEIDKSNAISLPDEKISALRFYDLVYRTLCAVMFNHSSSGHPGGSVSSGRIVESLLLSMMRYDFTNPNDKTADFICYTAGHKSLGLYAMWACRDEVMRITNPDALPENPQRIRLEDLLGFRKNPVTKTPLFKKFSSQALDGHPTPQTPFVWASTGPSGVGVTSSVGIALALKDTYGENAPYVNLIEGEGGMTPGRVSEALAAAASSRLNNIIMHVDWNQAAIDSNSVTREGNRPGDYAQWDPREFLLVHGFNVINVEDGFDFNQIHSAQERALALENTAPTAIVYRTTKGWRYGVEGKKSHGGGHKFCSDGYYEAIAPFEKELGLKFPRFEGEKNSESVEKAYFDSLLIIRKAFEAESEHTGRLGKLFSDRKDAHSRSKHPLVSEKINLSVLYESDKVTPQARPESCRYEIDSSQTLRGALAHVLNELNHLTGGAILATAADVYGSTNTLDIGKGFGDGLWRWPDNTNSRIFSAGGITEDAIGGICSG